MPPSTVSSKSVAPQNPLHERYASREMAALFSAAHRFRTWRSLWIALAESQKELGLDITAEQIQALRDVADNVDLGRVAEIERQTRHDVVAHIRHYAEQAARSTRERAASCTWAPPAPSSPTTPTSSSAATRCACCVAVWSSRAAPSVDFARRTKAFPAWPTPISSRPSSPPSASARRSGSRTSSSTCARSTTGWRRCAAAAPRAPPAPRRRT